VEVNPQVLRCEATWSSFIPLALLGLERGWTCTIDNNPIGFCLIVSMRGAFVVFAIAEHFTRLDLSAIPCARSGALPFLT
jgi:hypothetical protein